MVTQVSIVLQKQSDPSDPETPVIYPNCPWNSNKTITDPSEVHFCSCEGKAPAFITSALELGPELSYMEQQNPCASAGSKAFIAKKQRFCQWPVTVILFKNELSDLKFP